MGIESKLKSLVVKGALVLAPLLQGCPGRLSEEEIRKFDNEVYEHNLRQSQRFGQGGYVPRPTYAQPKGP